MRLNFISLLSKNTFLKLELATVNLLEFWKALAMVMKSFRQFGFRPILYKYRNGRIFIKRKTNFSQIFNLPIPF